MPEKSSELRVSSIPAHALEVKDRGVVIERQARVGQFRGDRKIDYEKVDGALVMKQFVGDRTLKFSTGAFRRGWDRIWGKA